MSIQITAKQNYSYLFSSLGSGVSNAASSNFLADYASIKNGSYGKLMKAYYSETANSTVKSLAKKNTVSKTDEENKTYTKVQSASDSLKEAADTLLASGSKSVFQQKDITTKDENGVETTTKGYDTNAIYKAVNNFVNSYNSVISATENTKDNTVNNRTSYMMQNTLSNQKSLEKIGIGIKEDGTLSLDKDTFMKSDMTAVKSLFQGNGSYGYQTSAQASLLNYAADHAANRTGFYSTSGSYNNASLQNGSLFNSYL